MTDSFPAITRRTVTGKWLKFPPDESPMTGTVRFAPSVLSLTDQADKVFTIGPYQAPLDSNGAISISLPVTDDLDFLPVGWHYDVTITVQEKYNDSTTQTITFPMNLLTDANPLDMTEVIPLNTIPALVVQPWTNITNYDPEATNHWSAAVNDGHMTFPALSVRQQTEDVFQFRGFIQCTGLPAAEEVVFTLPAGFEPSNPSYIKGVTAGAGFGVVPFRVEPNGDVVSTSAGGTAALISLDGCYYLK